MTNPINRPDDELPALPALQSYRDTAPAAFPPPPVETIEAAGRRRARRRAVTLAAATAVIVGVGAAGALASTGGDAQPVPPAATSEQPDPAPTTPPPSTRRPPESPSEDGSGASPSGPRPSTPAFDAIKAVDWRTATITLPSNPDAECVTGTVHLEPNPENPDPPPSSGEVTVGERRTRLGVRSSGDLTGDGRLEAVLSVFCEVGEYASGDGSGQLLVVGVDDDGGLRGLDYAGPVGYNYPTVEIVDGQLVTEVEERYVEERIQERTYEWDGERMVQVSGPTAFPPQ